MTKLPTENTSPMQTPSTTLNGSLTNSYPENHAINNGVIRQKSCMHPKPMIL